MTDLLKELAGRGEWTEETEQDVLRRVAQCLLNFRMESEVPARALNPDPIHKSFAGSGAPRKAGSSYATAVRSLLGWCELQEAAHRANIKGPDRRPETPQQFRARILNTPEYKGLSNAKVADKERLSESYIQKIRARQADESRA